MAARECRAALDAQRKQGRGIAFGIDGSLCDDGNACSIRFGRPTGVWVENMVITDAVALEAPLVYAARHSRCVDCVYSADNAMF